jgi:acyl dehydratase
MEFVPVEKLKEMIGQEMGLSDWVQIDQEKINQFAECTGDHQWIHVDIEKAKQGPFGGPIAHGFLTLSLIPVLSGSSKYMPEGIKMAINYGLNKVRFINPVPSGSRVRSIMILTYIEERSGGRVMMTTTHNIEIEGQDKPACVAESLALFYV